MGHSQAFLAINDRWEFSCPTGAVLSHQVLFFVLSLGLDFYPSLKPAKMMTEAAPLPVFRARA